MAGVESWSWCIQVPDAAPLSKTSATPRFRRADLGRFATLESGSPLASLPEVLGDGRADCFAYPDLVTVGHTDGGAPFSHLVRPSQWNPGPRSQGEGEDHRVRRDV